VAIAPLLATAGGRQANARNARSAAEGRTSFMRLDIRPGMTLLVTLMTPCICSQGRWGFKKKSIHSICNQHALSAMGVLHAGHPEPAHDADAAQHVPHHRCRSSTAHQHCGTSRSVRCLQGKGHSAPPSLRAPGSACQGSASQAFGCSRGMQSAVNYDVPVHSFTPRKFLCWASSRMTSSGMSCPAVGNTMDAGSELICNRQGVLHTATLVSAAHLCALARCR